MATHSTVLTWRISGTGEPGRLQSMRLLGVRHEWVTSLSLFTFMHWRRKWQPTPVFLPGESQGQGSLVGCRVRHNWSDIAAAAAAAAAAADVLRDCSRCQQSTCPCGSWMMDAICLGFQLSQMVKNTPAMQETWVQYLDWEDPLEKRKHTHSSILAWRIPWTVYSPWGHKESDMTERLSLFTFTNTRSWLSTYIRINIS